ncbi:MAG TPA: sulfatase [Longimicrobiaceae bacterium]
MPESLPNLVLIVLDCGRRDHFSCYGYKRETTPNIDRIASQGILFERAYAASCWTIPSHASLFTGLYPSQHRADANENYLDNAHTTLAELLSRRGYRTANITCNGFISRHTNLDKGFELSIDVGALRGSGGGWIQAGIRGIHRRVRDLTAKDRGARRATALASRWLGEQRSGLPFFLFMNYMDCHLPYRLRGRDRFRFLGATDRRRAERALQDPFAVMAGARTMSQQELIDLQALYDASLVHLDRQIGELDARLQELGLADETVFVITSDHGESFGEHRLLDHQYGLYEHLINVPLVMRLPRGERTGEVRRDFVQHVDLVPTVREWLGQSAAPTDAGSHAGRSIFGGAPRQAVMAEYLVPNVRAIRRRFPQADTSRFDVAMRCIRTDHFKLVERSDGKHELYDLDADPFERMNLAGSRADLVVRLQAQLQYQLGSLHRGDTRDRDTSTPPEVRQRLEALGYL